MRRFQKAAVCAALLALFLLAMTALGPAPAAAQEDCENNCYDGHWDPWFLACISYPTGSCSYCEAICPGGGGDPPQPENKV